MPVETPLIPSSFQRRALTLDVAKYQTMLDAPDMDEQTKVDFIKALWNLVVCFIDLDYEILPLQACGKGDDDCTANQEDTQSVLSSNDATAKQDFAAASAVTVKEAS